MANTTEIHVTKCDNELQILASTGRESSELCRVKGGFGDPVDFKFNPGHILPPGSYDLTFVGINWGGPWQFVATTTPGGVQQGSGSGPAGVVWTKTIPITV
jgi:hypothetical protein